MKALLIHNRYRIRGGEDRVFDDEVRLLLEAGHEVIPVTSRWPESTGLLDLPSRAAEAVWSSRWKERVIGLIRSHRPDVLHAHNLFPVISPSVLAGAREEGVPTVVTLHNYRLLCASGDLFRDGRPCENCVGRLPWRGVAHGCYHDSVIQSAAVGWMIWVQRFSEAWSRNVDRFIVPSEFARSALTRGGLPPEKLTVKPHAVHPDPEPRNGSGSHAIWAGRLSAEKGVALLQEGWQGLEAVPIRVAGTGPLEDRLQSAAVPGMTLLGEINRESLMGEMKAARFLVSTSLCYETFGLVVAEAFACGVPAIVPEGGALAELVSDGRTGLRYPPGDAAAFRERVSWAWSHPGEMEAMGRAARRTWEERGSASSCACRLLEIYAEVTHGG